MTKKCHSTYWWWWHQTCTVCPNLVLCTVSMLQNSSVSATQQGKQRKGRIRLQEVVKQRKVIQGKQFHCCQWCCPKLFLCLWLQGKHHTSAGFPLFMPIKLECSVKQLLIVNSFRALVSYGFGNLHWAATHVISMAGAFCAGVAVYGFRAANDDVPGWQVQMPHTFLFKYSFVRSVLSVQ